MQDALIFIGRTLIDLYIITFILRMMMQWVRADFRNPLTQFILRVTNPLVIPLRRVVPAVGNLDTASLIVVLLLELIVTIVLVSITCAGELMILQIMSLTILRTVYLVLRVYLFIILIYVILSWISPGAYNPAAALLTSIAEPVLRPVRRYIPPVGGLDLSALFALIAIQAVTMLLPIGRVASTMGCFSLGQFL
ncbi:MAG: YggT family protein [Gammaproteobacteria bacterium]|nr:YggT family protein [Gammaproteobacteria bacterium]MBT8443457.1 YggT family protein [Gammaproteobacteria bacterium]NND37348.1 YggT family protein [Gammaproteobacteria bacterium]